MDKIKNIIKNHFVEVVGFICIMLLIMFILYLKYYRKTFTCESRNVLDSAVTEEKYIVKQKNNRIKSVYYKYTADLKNASSKEANNFYSKALKALDIENSDIELSYKNNKITLSYTLYPEDFKNNRAYRSTRVFIRNIKSSGFSCK